MGLTRFSVKRPLSILMVILGLVVLGFRSYNEMQVERMPAMDMPMVSISVTYSGASPEDVETDVVDVIEDAVAGVSGIDSITSYAYEGQASIMLQFKQEVDAGEAAIDVQRRVSSVRGRLPSDAGEPSITKAGSDSMPMMQMILKGPQGQDVLYDYAENELSTRLQAVVGVASVNVSGGREQVMLISPDPVKLSAYGISLSQLSQALSANNLSSPAGTIHETFQSSSVRAVGKQTSIAEIENIIVSDKARGGAEDTGGIVRLRDVATVEVSYEEMTQLVRYNGMDAVSISIVKNSDANTLDVAAGVRQTLERYQRDMPEGSEIIMVSDDSVYTQESVDAVVDDLVLAVFITGLIMLFFLHTIRSTFIVILAIPTSLISTFLVMWAVGFTLNTLTLLALTLTIGILVDDSIVVLENIERHLHSGKDRRQAALDGRAEIGLAAITITLVDVAIYVPVAFTSGMIGQMLRSYGITIAIAVLFSLFVSFTLTPMLASRWMQEVRAEPEAPRKRSFLGQVFHIVGWPVATAWSYFGKAWDWLFDGLAYVYAGLIQLIVRSWLVQVLVLLISAAALVGTGFLVVTGAISMEMMPTEDDGKLSISLDLPPGTPLESTDLAAREAEAIIREQVPETASILTRVGSRGGGPGGSSGSNQAEMTVVLVDKNQRARSTTDIVNALRPEINSIPDVEASLSLASSFGGGAMKAVSLNVTGPETNEIADLTDQIAEVMAGVPGVVDIDNSDALRSPEVRFVIDSDRTQDAGLTASSIASTLRTALNGSTVGTFSQEGADDIDIVLQLDEKDRKNLTQLQQLPVAYVGGKVVSLGQVANLERDETPGTIRHSQRQRVMSISCGSAGVASGDLLNSVTTAIDRQVEFPDGYAYKLSGMSEMQGTMFNDLYAALGLGILLVYMLLVFLFESWLDPLAIMMSLPVAVVGAVGGLWLFDYSLSMMSMLGMILLAGIVTKNAILLVDFTNELRRRGYNRREALVEAGKLRLRPILMTSMALIFAMLPVLLQRSAGAESRSPLAAVVIGGSVTSTLLTLVLVPVVYSWFDTGRNLFGRLVRLLTGRQETAPSSQSLPGVASSSDQPVL